MSNNIENWRNRKLLLWSGYYPGSATVYKELAAKTERTEMQIPDSIVSYWLIQQLAESDAEKKVAEAMIYVR